MTVKTLGDHIQFKRVEKGFTYAELAVKTKVAKSKVLLWEKDTKLPNELQWKAMESLTGLDPTLKPT